LALLEKYGGVWLDADVMVFGTLLPYVQKLAQYDYVGFGCYFNDCGVRKNGAPRPGTWNMVSRPHGELVTLARQRADFMLDHYAWVLQQRPHAIGIELVWLCIDDLLRERADNRAHGRATGWKYYHVGSKCVEHDSRGVRFSNMRMLRNEHVDPKCVGRMLALPIGNTAPGLSRSFLSMSANDILEHPDMLISRFFRWTLLDVTPMNDA